MDVRKLDSPLLLANSPESWSVSVLLASEELQDTEWLMVGLMAAGLSAPEELEAWLSSRGRNIQLSWWHDPEKHTHQHDTKRCESTVPMSFYCSFYFEGHPRTRYAIFLSYQRENVRACVFRSVKLVDDHSVPTASLFLSCYCPHTFLTRL